MNEQEILVSIIVPVYNAENHLGNCIESILKQTYKSYEVILIDDGSTDKSLDICNYYAKKDDRIKVIKQENSGPSAARNKGISYINGTFVQFVDSDDSLEPQMIKCLVDSMLYNNVELVISAYNAINLTNGIISKKGKSLGNVGVYKIEDFLKVFGNLFISEFINPLWNKLYIKDVITSNNITFKENIMMGEDLLFNLEYVGKCKNICLINEQLYNYVLFNFNSLTSSYEPEKFNKQKVLYQNVRGFLEKYDQYLGENKEALQNFYTNSIVSSLWNLFHKNSSLSPRIIRENIKKIVNDASVRNNLDYFRTGNIQKKIIGYLVDKKNVLGIYWFFVMKRVLWGKVRRVATTFRK